MQFFAGLLVLSLIFIVIFILGLLLVFRKSWLLVWLRANFGIFCLFFGIVGIAGLYLLSDMHSIDGEVRFGTVDVHQLGIDSKFVRISTERLGERDIELIEGNWRLRAMHVKWSGFFSMLGISDGVLLYDMQESDGQGRNSSVIIEHEAVTKVWELGRTYLQWLPGVQFEFLATEWYSKDLNATYALSATKAGLMLRNLNEKAKPGTAQILFENDNNSLNGESETQAPASEETFQNQQ